MLELADDDDSRIARRYGIVSVVAKLGVKRSTSWIDGWPTCLYNAAARP